MHQRGTLSKGMRAVFWTLTVAAAAPALGGTDSSSASYKWEKEIFVPMRDGVHLSTDVIRDPHVRGPMPTILDRTPYDKDRIEWAIFKPVLEKFIAHGYALVLQNERGRWWSEGRYENYLSGASTDGYDTLEWIAKQPWSNGKVGTFGCSSSGEQQWPMAASNHPAHAAMLPNASGTAVGAVPGNDTQGAMYRGGVPVLALWAWWYHDMTPTERLVLPASTTQEERIRLRAGYNFQPATAFFRQAEDGSLDWLSPKPELRALMGHLPSADILRALGGPLTPWDKYATYTPADPRWRQVETIKAPERPKVPAIHLSTWHDIGVGETTRLFKYLEDLVTPNQYLIIGAGPHCSYLWEDKFANFSFGDLPLGDIRYRARDDGYFQLWLDWFDYWVAGKPNHVTDMPHVQLKVMHGPWLMSDKWPLPQTRFTTYFLTDRSMGSPSFDTGALAATLPRSNAEQAFVYDPAEPTPTLGGETGIDENNARDQRPVEARKDVLVYSSAPLPAPLTIAGPVAVTLYVSSSARDTDFMVKLVDVFPDGKAINLSEDAFRVRYREGFDRKDLMVPGRVYKLILPNMVTAIRFQKGHRIRLEVASSNFPLFERNLNTGGNNFDEATWVVARNVVHVGPKYPSAIVLPVIPEGSPTANNAGH